MRGHDERERDGRSHRRCPTFPSAATRSGARRRWCSPNSCRCSAGGAVESRRPAHQIAISRTNAAFTLATRRRILPSRCCGLVARSCGICVNNARFDYRAICMRDPLFRRVKSRLDRTGKRGRGHGFCSVGRGDQRDPRLVDDEGQGAARGRARPRRSAAWCSTTRCSRSGCRSRSITRCAGRSRTASRSTPSVADAVATALKDWAVEHGATHYTHWFQPLTGITAEKHDSFLIADRRRQGGRGVLAARN